MNTVYGTLDYTTFFFFSFIVKPCHDPWYPFSPGLYFQELEQFVHSRYTPVFYYIYVIYLSFLLLRVVGPTSSSDPVIDDSNFPVVPSSFSHPLPPRSQRDLTRYFMSRWVRVGPERTNLTCHQWTRIDLVSLRAGTFTERTNPVLHQWT